MFAIVDVETTGSHHSEDKITEIAIIITDGEKVLAEFQSLVNPLRPIDPFVQKLTGITNRMVKDAPTFPEIAEQVYTMLHGNYFVAHNVAFDYSLVDKELAAAGIALASSRIDTVSYSRRIFPGLESYSLGKICDYTAIPHLDKHRAYGDTFATMQLFHLLLTKDENKRALNIMLNHGLDESLLPPALQAARFFELPEQAGVLTFKNKEGKVLAAEAAKNIRRKAIEKIQQLAHELADKELFHSIIDIDVELTGNELMARIKRSELLAGNGVVSRIAKQRKAAYAIILEENGLGVIQMKTVSFKEAFRETYIPFTSKTYANKTIEKLMNENGFYGLYNQILAEENERLKSARIIEYNTKVKHALLSNTYPYPNMIIVDKGCDKYHHSVIWVEDGRYRGRAFVPKDCAIHKNNIEEWIEVREETTEIQKSIRAYLKRTKVIKLIRY